LVACLVPCHSSPASYTHATAQCVTIQSTDLAVVVVASDRHKFVASHYVATDLGGGSQPQLATPHQCPSQNSAMCVVVDLPTTGGGAPHLGVAIDGGQANRPLAAVVVASDDRHMFVASDRHMWHGISRRQPSSPLFNYGTDSEIVSCHVSCACNEWLLSLPTAYYYTT
jgi:hypothetical protein